VAPLLAPKPALEGTTSHTADNAVRMWLARYHHACGTVCGARFGAAFGVMRGATHGANCATKSGARNRA
jgi:hypothetical protein